MGPTYLILPILAMVVAGYAASLGDTGSIFVAVVFTLFAAIEWRAYWIYRDRQSG